MKESKPVIKVTAMLHRNISSKAVSALKSAGVKDIYLNPGRIPFLAYHSGIKAVFKPQSLVSYPAEIITCFVEPAVEKVAMEILSVAGNMEEPGKGSVYTETIQMSSRSTLFHCDKVVSPINQNQHFYHDLTAIQCVVQRGQGDKIAQAVLEMGSAVPVITYGTGTGFRDQIGILRITIPADKEIVNLVVPSWEADYVMEAMISAGQLELPGRGFISTRNVSMGRLDTKMTNETNVHAASLEQIIHAIDHLNDSMEWRRNTRKSSASSNRLFFTGMELKVFCNEGTGLGLAEEAMKIGVGGATIEQQNLRGEAEVNKDYLSRAREVCRMFTTEEVANKFLQKLKDIGAFSDKVQAVAYFSEVPKAFTYIPKADVKKVA